MEKNWTIRKRRLEDQESFAGMLAKSWLDTYVNQDLDIDKEWIEGVSRFRKERDTDEKIAATLGNNDWRYLVAVDKDGEVIGGSVQKVLPVNEQDLQALYIDKSYKGSGLAQDFMKEIMNGFDLLKPKTLGVATYNDRAKAFYLKYNFKEVPGSETKFLDKIPEIKMIRKGDKK